MEVSQIFIFGDFTLLFTSIIAFCYMMMSGGFLKGLYGGMFFNLLMIMLGYWLNTAYDFTQNLLVLVIFEMLMVILWVMSIRKA